MFEQIIKKIEAVEFNDFGFQSYRDGFQHGLNKAIEIIKEAEVEKFDPESLGFKIKHNDGIDGQYTLKTGYDTGYNLYFTQSNIYSLCVIKPYPEDSFYKFMGVKIESHVFGVELLESLGV